MSEATTHHPQSTSDPTLIPLSDGLPNDWILSSFLKKTSSALPSAKIRKKASKKSRFLSPNLDDTTTAPSAKADALASPLVNS